MSGQISRRDMENFDAFLQVVLEIAPKLIDVLKEVVASNRALETKLAVLEKKLDQSIVREIHGAFNIIDAITTVASVGMKERHLLQAEANLLNNLSLDPTLKTMGEPNFYWMGRSYFGLSQIALIRDENLDASRLLLHVFRVSPRDARKNLASDLFARTVEPGCSDLRAEYERKLGLLPKWQSEANALNKSIGGKRLEMAGAVALGAGWALLANGSQRSMAVAKTTNEVSKLQNQISEIQKEIAGIPTKESLLAEMEEAIDLRCQEYAERLLGSTG